MTDGPPGTLLSILKFVIKIFLMKEIEVNEKYDYLEYIAS